MLIKGPFERSSGVGVLWVVTGTTFLTDAALLGCHSPRRRIVEQPDPWCLGTRQLPCRGRAGDLCNKLDRWALALVTGVYEPRTL
jgi:hypothetical protein